MRSKNSPANMSVAARSDFCVIHQNGEAFIAQDLSASLSRLSSQQTRHVSRNPIRTKPILTGFILNDATFLSIEDSKRIVAYAIHENAPNSRSLSSAGSRLGELKGKPIAMATDKSRGRCELLVVTKESKLRRYAQLDPHASLVDRER